MATTQKQQELLTENQEQRSVRPLTADQIRLMVSMVSSGVTNTGSGDCRELAGG